MAKSNWHAKLRKEVLSDPEACAEYAAFKLQLALAQGLKEARLKNNLTQEDVANKMDTHKAAIARLEAGGGKNKHSPSVATLMKFAQAIGCYLQINLIQIKAKRS